MPAAKTKAQFLFHKSAPFSCQPEGLAIVEVPTAPYAAIDAGVQTDGARMYFWAYQYYQYSATSVRVGIVNTDLTEARFWVHAIAVNQTDAEAPSGVIESELTVIESRGLTPEELREMGPHRVPGGPPPGFMPGTEEES